MLAVCGFAAEHNGVGALEDRVSHVGDLRAGWTRILYHTLKHLCCHDDRLLALAAGVNYPLLYQRNTLRRNLNSEVTARNHHSVAVGQNVVEIVHSLLIFNLGDELDGALGLIEYPLDFEQVGGTAYE